tara:strand:+ start:511 stop:828 length:318 start_codon:yes stop_codon:yes gene_type:complete
MIEDDNNNRSIYTVELDLFRRIDQHLAEVRDGLQEVREKLIVIEAQEWKEKIDIINEDIKHINSELVKIKLEHVSIKTKLIPITGFGTILVTALITAWLAGTLPF